MKTFKTFSNPDKVTSFILYFSILAFIIAFNFSDNPKSGWQQQFMPNFNGKPLKDITFTDSLTGYALIGYENSDSNFILKTTNSGDNWVVIRIENNRLNKIFFLNSDTGFTYGSDLLGFGYLIKTKNGGHNWDRINTPPEDFKILDLYALSSDSIWIIDSYLSYFIRKTTNGGISWINQFQGNYPLKEIYMFNFEIGFMCDDSKLYKTTNSGDNWILQPGQKAFLDIYFADSLLGWKKNSVAFENDTLVKTTNGGENWFNVDVPRRGTVYGGSLYPWSHVDYFSNLNKDTIWSSGGAISYPGNILKGILYKSNNGGQNWLIQVPDTGFGLPQYFFNNFINKNIGWTYNSFFNIGIHTTTGGDTTFLTRMNNLNESIPDSYTLFQNYPNPFNPSTVISYKLQATSLVKLKVFTVQGKEIKTLVNQKQNAGEYKVTFDGTGYMSGVYFYSLFLNGKLADTKKMIYLK